MIRQLVISVVVLLIPIAATAAKTPAWILTPTPDSASTLYGIGEGKNLKSATQSALDSIAGKLVTHIQSSIQINTSSKNDVVSDSMNSNISAKVGETIISNYEVELTEKIKKRYFVRVNVPRSKLIDSNNSALQEELNELSNYLDPTRKVSVIKIYQKRYRLEGSITSAQQKLQILIALTDSHTVQKDIKKIQLFKQSLENRLLNMLVYIQAPKELALFAQQIAQQLSDDGIAATTKKPAMNTPKVAISGNFTRGERFNQKYANARTQIEVFDEYASVISTTQMVLEGQAYLSHESAITAAINKAIETMSDEGVATSLGLI